MRLFERASSYERGRDVVSWALAICAWECRTIRTRSRRRRESFRFPQVRRTVAIAASPCRATCVDSSTATVVT